MNSRTHYHAEVVAFLEEEGATDVCLARDGKRSKHPKVTFTWHGRRLSRAVAGSPSDSVRGTRNMIAELRRMMRELPCSLDGGGIR